MREPLRQINFRLRKKMRLMTFAFVGLSLATMSLTTIPVYAATPTATSYQAAASGSSGQMVPDSNGNLWYLHENTLVKMNTSGVTLAQYSTGPNYGIGVVVGPDGNLWVAGDTFQGNGIITSMSPSGSVVATYILPSSVEINGSLTVGPDGNLWFGEYNQNTNITSIGNITTSGAITTYALPSEMSSPGNLTPTVGPDHNLWFFESDSDNNTTVAVSMTTSGAITTYALPSGAGTNEPSFVVGPDGNLWFSYIDTNDNYFIASMTTSGSIAETYALPSGVLPGPLTVGPDGNLWFNEKNTDGTAVLASMTTAGTIATYPSIPVDPGTLFGDYITVGPDHNLWMNNGSLIYKVNVAGQPPVIAQLSNATINEGDTFSESGSFTDSSSTSWTATVDYGDGAGQQSLPLSGDNFSLSHAYENSGNYTVTVTITNEQGLSSTATTTVTVNAPFTLSVITAPNTVSVNQSLPVTANYSDPGTGGNHVATWSWGDASNNSTDTISGTNGTFNDSHTYINVGSYTITLSVVNANNTKLTSTFVVAVGPANGSYANDPHLKGTNFSGANLSGVNMSGSQMQGVTFNGTDLQGTNLSGVTAQGARFQNANLTNANLSGSQLQSADFTGANLTGTTATGATFNKANFTGANLTGANFSGATLNNVTWSNTICPNGTNSNNDGGTCRGQGGGL